MTITLEHFINTYQPMLKHNDEKIILLFHWCMLDNNYFVVGGIVTTYIIIFPLKNVFFLQSNYLFVYEQIQDQPLQIKYKKDNTILETRHNFLGDTYIVQYVSTFFYMGQCQRIVFLDFG
jgi:hypothetical protein